MRGKSSPEYYKRYRELNREKRNAFHREWYQRNKESQREKSAVSRQANKEENKARLRRWFEKNPDKNAEYVNRRRSKKLSAKGSFSALQIKQRIALFGNSCAYCGDSNWSCLDHVIPLSRGGSNWPSNIRPSCKSCNSSKGSKSLAEWGQFVPLAYLGSKFDEGMKF